MSNEKQGTENKPIKENPQLWHVAIIQADFPEQMDVLRYIRQHPEQYPCVIAILHDKDVFSEDDEEDAERFKDGLYVRKNADGTESEYHLGDHKPAHYHVMLRATKKIRSSSLTLAFSKQVHFMRCENEIQYAHYLTHNTFRARKRHQYDPGDVCQCEYTNKRGWSTYSELTLNSGIDFSDVCEIWQDVLENVQGSMPDAVGLLIVNGQTEVLKQVASKSNFFDKFFKHL